MPEITGESKGILQEENDDKEQVLGIIDDIIENSPVISEGMENLNTDSTENLQDKNGNPFNPEIHRVDENNKPILNKNGTLKVKYRKKVTNEPEQAMSNQNAGQLFATYTVVIATSLFGEDFIPKKTKEIDEMSMLTKAYAEYFETKNIEDIPPGYVLLGSLSLYFLPRLMAKTAQASIKTKIKYLWTKTFGKKKA